MSALTRINPFRGSSWVPFREIGELENRLEKYFGKPLPPGNGGKEAMAVAQWAPVVDITEDQKEYLVKAELPEIKK
jgi:HSP20 family protein